MRVACLVDTTRCIGCRSCQVACKQSNRLAGETTKFFAAPGGYQNPRRTSPRTFTYISFHEREGTDDRPAWAFVKHQCMHCRDMYCAYVCGPQVYSRTPTGIVAYQPDYCIGCAACVDACPFGVPALDYWNVASPQVRKCTFCIERQQSRVEEAEIDGRPLAGAALERHQSSFRTPACAKACPSGTLQFGERDELLAEAKRRIAIDPGKYVDHVYGEKEAGGTGWLYLAAVPFDQLGFPMKFENLDAYEKLKVGAAQPRRPVLAAFWNGLGALAGGACWFFRRREEVRAFEDRGES